MPQIQAERQNLKLQATLQQSSAPDISLTLINTVDGVSPGPIRVSASHLIAYDQQCGFTRLTLIGGRVLDVKEGTDQIDRLIRTAASNANFP